MILKSVGVLSAAKVSGAIAAFMGLIGGAFMALFSFLATAVNAPQNGPHLPAAFLGISAIIFVPIFYGAFGFVMGAIYALVYNFIAGVVGGLKLEFEHDATISNLP